MNIQKLIEAAIPAEKVELIKALGEQIAFWFDYWLIDEIKRRGGGGTDPNKEIEILYGLRKEWHQKFLDDRFTPNDGGEQEQNDDYELRGYVEKYNPDDE